MRFYPLKDEVITRNVDLDSTHMCYFLSVKSYQDEVVEEKSKRGKPTKGDEVNLANIIVRYDPDSLEEEGMTHSPKN